MFSPGHAIRYPELSISPRDHIQVSVWTSTSHEEGSIKESPIKRSFVLPRVRYVDHQVYVLNGGFLPLDIPGEVTITVDAEKNKYHHHTIRVGWRLFIIGRYKECRSLRSLSLSFVHSFLCRLAYRRKKQELCCEILRARQKERDTNPGQGHPQTRRTDGAIEVIQLESSTSSLGRVARWTWV